MTTTRLIQRSLHESPVPPSSQSAARHPSLGTVSRPPRAPPAIRPTPPSPPYHTENSNIFVRNMTLLLVIIERDLLLCSIEIIMPNGWWYMPPEPVPADPGWDEDLAWLDRDPEREVWLDRAREHDDPPLEDGVRGRHSPHRGGAGRNPRG